MNEVRFIKDNYRNLKKEQVEKFLAVYKERVIRVCDGDKLKGIAFYFKLTDKTLEGVRNKSIDLTNPDIVNKCFEENGDNIHFFSVVADGYKTIMSGLRETMNNNIKSVSWFSSDMKRFFIRRLLCRQS